MKPSVPKLPLSALSLPILTLSVPAQDFTTPGMPQQSRYGQTDRFSNEFNPAIGVIVDTEATYLWSDDDDAEGIDFDLRVLEFTTNAWIDPTAWGYAVIVSDGEEIEAEEAALHYLGFGERTTVRAGEFFVDFGKQMQAHVHDLAYPARPLVLRRYLGDELGGTGMQVDHWFATGDESALRFSFGVFDSLAGGGHGHGHGEEEEEEGPEVHVDERMDAGDLSYTARVTQFMDVGENGVFQWGASARHVGGFGLEDDENGLEEEDLSNTVYGFDLTYGWTDETGTSGWTIGTEALFAEGDLGGEVVDPGGGPELEVFDDDVMGWYLWIEREMDRNNAAGVLYSVVEEIEHDTPETSEATVYWSRYLSEYLRFRVAVSHLDPDEGDSETEATIQLTGFLGPHAHGVSW